MWSLMALSNGKESNSEKITVHLKTLLQLENENPYILNKLNQLLLYSQNHPYRHEVIKNFLEEALKGDVCKLIESYGNYFDPRVLNIDCQMVMNGILKRGFIISVQKLL